MGILLVDNNECKVGGHNYLYRQALNSIKGTVIYEDRVEFREFRDNIIGAIKDRCNYLKKVSKKDDDVHLLHFDKFYKAPIAIKKLKNKGRKIYGTIHWYPGRKIDRYLLKKSAQYLDVIIVHSQYIKTKLNEFGIPNVEVIDYPAFIDDSCNKILSKKVKNNNIVISCLGGTRADKGLDVLMEAFKDLNSKAKERIIFNVAGAEGDIKYGDLKNQAQLYGVKVETTERLLSDEEYWENINKSKVILLPYKKIFRGNSGPMTDGVYANKYILGPDGGNLGFLINKYNLGTTFVQEDPKSLADELNSLCNKNLDKNHSYKKCLEVDTFISRYKDIYRKY